MKKDISNLDSTGGITISWVATWAIVRSHHIGIVIVQSKGYWINVEIYQVNRAALNQYCKGVQGI